MIIGKLSNDYNDARLKLKGSSNLQMTGNNCLTVDNCHGIEEYNENLIRLRLAGDYLTIVGSDFHMTSFYNDGVIIRGVIHSLEFEEITEKRR